MTDKLAEIELDARDLLCPLPVLKARKKLEAMPSGAVLKVVATDPMSVIDMPHFCSEQGHALLDTSSDKTTHVFRIRKK